MTSQKHLLPSLVIAALLVTAAEAGQAKPAAKPAPPAPTQTSAPPARLAPAVRGEAELGYTKPASKSDAANTFIITTMKVKNLSTGAIAGLKIEEYW